MSHLNNHSPVGEQFREAVAKGLASGDFRELNDLVTDTVTEAISGVGKQVKGTYDRSHSYVHYERPATPKPEVKPAAKQNKALPAVKVKNVGQVSGVLYTVFGGIGTGVFSVACLLLFALSFDLSFVIPWLAAAGIAGVASVVMLRKGILQRGRLERMKRYVSLCADKMYINIADLAQQVGKGRRFVIKDVKKMIELGYFPEGHLDSKETCLMLDDKIYKEYLQLEKQRKLLEKEGISRSIADKIVSTEALDKAAAEAKNEAESVSMEQENPELFAMISEGNAYISKLHELNDIIPEEVISMKMDRMESLLREIFARLKEEPEEMHQMHKLMNYYLPTTIKLLQSYSEFDDISDPGPDIISAKAEIEKTVDTINEAFAELLNKLFQATVFDATTDAQVLQTMLAKEGLTKNAFSEEIRNEQ